MPASDYLEGVVVGGLTLALVIAGSVVFARRRLGDYVGAERVVAVGLVATFGLLATHLIPAALGILGVGSVLAVAAIWCAGLSLVPAVPLPATTARAVTEVADRGPVVLAALAAGLLLVLALAYARDLLFVAPERIDALNFHLPGVARWIQTDSIWQIDVFVADASPGHYPNSGNVALLAAVLPWNNDFLVRYAMYPFWALTGVAVFALARQLRCAPGTAVSAACLLLAAPTVTITALDGGFVDPLTLFGIAAGLLFCLRHHRTEHTSDLVLAGIAFGIALGTKWYGLSSVAVVIGVWALARAWTGVGLRTVTRQATIVTLVGLATGGIWLVRNLVESGNPFFPVKVAPLGITIFDAPPDTLREAAGFTLLDYVDDPGVWPDLIVPQLRDAFGLAALVVAAGLVTAVVLLLRRGTSLAPDRGPIRAGIAMSLLLLAVYSITPYTAGGVEGEPTLVFANARYAAPALIPAVVIGAWAATRFRRGPLIFGAATLAAVVDGIVLAGSGDLSQAAPGLGAWVIGVGVTLAITGLAWAVPSLRARLAERSSPARRRAHLALGAVGAVAVVAIVAAGHLVQKEYSERRYVGADPATDPLATSAEPRRVGLVAAWGNEYSPAYPAFGPRLENDVRYVGRWTDDVFRRFERKRDFVGAVRDGRYDVLVVGLRPEGSEPPELRWARSAGFEPVAGSERLVLLAQATAAS